MTTTARRTIAYLADSTEVPLISLIAAGLEARSQAAEQRPALTGRALRRAEQRQQARAFARNHGQHVVTHVHRALSAASFDGYLTAGAYLATLGVDPRYAAAFGNVVRETYEENHGAKPNQGGWSIVNGRMRSTYRYSNELDLIAGALNYTRTRELVLAHVAAPNHPMAHAYAGV